MIILEKILACILIGGGVVYFFTCLTAFAGHLKPRRINTHYNPFVSVIIAARNEEKNIGAVLNDLLNQDYPCDKLQIVVVDDYSEDGTRRVVEKCIAKDKRVHLREARFSKSPYTYKKRALHAGIRASGGEIILTVDADCRVPCGWIRGMVAHFVPEIDLVAGEVRPAAAQRMVLRPPTSGQNTRAHKDPRDHHANYAAMASQRPPARRLRWRYRAVAALPTPVAAV